MRFHEVLEAGKHLYVLNSGVFWDLEYYVSVPRVASAGFDVPEFFYLFPGLVDPSQESVRFDVLYVIKVPDFV